jgi:diguanylate cyclase (GGDEF)-like protein/PAS domain S-box-containing protein
MFIGDKIKKFIHFSSGEKVIFIVVLFVLIAIFTANMLYLQGKVLDGVRAYVRGEGLWAKGQKNAALYLERYTYSGNETDYLAFRKAVLVNIGDQNARNALYKTPPDLKKAREGFLQGQNHTDDVGALIWFFLNFQTISYMHDAIEIWKQADVKIGELRLLGQEIRIEIQKPQRNAYKIRTMRQRLYVLDRELAVLENRFSAVLGEGARWVKQTVWVASFGILILLVSIGIYVSRQIIKGINRAQRELMISESRFRSLYESNTIGIFAWGMDGSIKHANDYFLQMLGYTRTEVKEGKISWRELTPPSMRDRDEQAINELNLYGNCKPFEKALIHKQGHAVPVYLGASLIQGDTQQGIAYIMDLSERKKSEAQLRLASTVFKASYDGLLITDASMQIIAANEALCRMTGYSEEELQGKTPKLLQSGHTANDQYDEMRRCLSANGHYEGDLFDRTKEGRLLPMRISISSVQNEAGEVSHYVAILSDITERKEKEEELNHIAYFDELTGLPNRVLLNDRLEQRLKRAKRNESKFAVLFVDLDKFKPINDTFGHHIGDRLLQIVAARLLQHVRMVDTVARLGGDEFVILLDEIADGEMIEKIVHKITDAVTAPCNIEGHDIQVSLSIGLSVYPDNATDAQSLLHYADIAMYDSKKNEKKGRMDG